MPTAPRLLGTGRVIVRHGLCLRYPGLGLSGEAQPEFVKVFWFFFAKKNRFLCRLPSAEAISIPGQLPFFKNEGLT
jgi:hypothetical protein